MSPAGTISLVTKPSADRKALSPFGAFIDRLLQTFEDRRPGLTEATLAKGERACEEFFLQVYEGQAKAETDATLKEAEALSKRGGDAYVKMRLAKQFASKRFVIVPATSVSTMNMNKVVDAMAADAFGAK